MGEICWKTGLSCQNSQNLHDALTAASHQQSYPLSMLNESTVSTMFIKDEPTSDDQNHFIEMMKEIETVDPLMNLLVVPGSSLHAKINDPFTDGIDES